MKRTGPPARKTPMRRVSKKMRKRDAAYPSSRTAIYERAEGMCEASTCGIECPKPMTDVHHIRGREIPDPHDLSNLIGLCWWHHRKVHAEPEWARETGLMATRHGGAA